MGGGAWPPPWQWGPSSLPQGVFADDDWRDEIDFELIEPVPGRRLYVEGLTVSGDTAAVTLQGRH